MTANIISTKENQIEFPYEPQNLPSTKAAEKKSHFSTRCQAKEQSNIEHCTLKMTIWRHCIRFSICSLLFFPAPLFLKLQNWGCKKKKINRTKICCPNFVFTSWLIDIPKRIVGFAGKKKKKKVLSEVVKNFYSLPFSILYDWKTRLEWQNETDPRLVDPLKKDDSFCEHRLSFTIVLFILLYFPILALVLIELEILILSSPPTPL